MSRRKVAYTTIASASALALSLAAVPLVGQSGSGGPVRYTMDAGTTSGLGSMSVGSVMGGIFGGGGGGANHSLILKMGSGQRPAKGEAKADHFMPASAKLGKSVALLGGEGTRREGESEYQRPKGKLRIYWGCGAKAGKGQPIVIDFAKIAAGQMPPNLFTNSVQPDWDVHPSNSTSYIDWPNRKGGKQLGGNSSIRGAHRIAANVSPEIAFTLNQDFMPAVNVNGSDNADGSVGLNWNNVAGATGYYGWAMSFNPDQNGEAIDMTWWTSSSTQQFGGDLWGWIAPATVNRLIGQKTVMPPSQTSCTIPAEVKKSGGQMVMANLYAYGPEENFAEPRPTNAGPNWQPAWIARARFRSHGSWMAGMPGMASMGAEGQQPGEPAKKKKKCGGLLGSVVGVPC